MPLSSARSSSITSCWLNSSASARSWACRRKSKLRSVCAVLGVAILMISKEFNLLQSIVYSVATAIGFALALVLFAGIRERLELEDVPKAVQGVPVALITAGILAMAFMGFSGLV